LAEVFNSPPADLELKRLDPQRIPEHIAVIMDGNGRWAEQHGLARALGHREGIKAVRELIQAANDIGVRYLTIFSFSSENWSRPAAEVKTLMRLFAQTLTAELEPLYEKGVRVLTIGDLGPLPKATRRVFENAVAKTCDNTGMSLVIAVNYGGRQEIVEAARRVAADALAGRLNADGLAALDTQGFATYLDTAGLPDPELLLRTSGEERVSNFMLYQIAYSEIVVLPVLWPDFDRYQLLRALFEYQGRERRFGGLK